MRKQKIVFNTILLIINTNLLVSPINLTISYKKFMGIVIPYQNFRNFVPDLII